MIERIARGLARRARHGMLLVAIDGPDHAGKTTFGRELVDALRPLLPDTSEVRRFSADDYLVPIDVRRSQAAADPQWIYDHSHDLAQIREMAEGMPELDPAGSICVIDGMTLQRPELVDLWHTTIFLTIPDAVVLERVVQNEPNLYDSLEEALGRYRERYLPAHEIYTAAVGPAERADVLIEMLDFQHPSVLRWGTF